ncbi:MAG: hypothetical protein FWD23_01400 [Oscillospiraceae bacterium]|nr:hypothetical protein [Oscillospiraceae bacterium]
MKKRSEGFFGLHFDFHAGADCVEVGKNVTHEMVREIIETLKPDYIQCDCKGHAGYSSYQTKAGNPAPGFVGDQLRIWRDVTKEYGIPLTVHYSGVWDMKALELRPEWAAINEDGSPNKNMTSTFKGYADGLLIPQLAELALEYEIDAVWVDGECWATVPDFDAEVISAFEKESGQKLVKGQNGKYDRQSAEYRGFLDFCRKRFFEYLSHYVNEVHAKAPNFEIASNWAFSSHIPAPVCVDVDYLSGDFTPVDSYNGARFEARVLCEQGMPWDLMAWGFFHDFTPKNVHSIKGAAALCREAAGVISTGGGFQVYNTQNRDGSVRLWEVGELAETAKFVREREPFLKGAAPFSDIGVLYSDFDMKNRCDTLFYPRGNDNVKGAVKAVLDSSRTCAVLMDHTLNGDRLKETNIVIVPELRFISGEIKAKLLEYAANGGNLIISGHECCGLFGEVLKNAEISGEAKERAISVPFKSRFVNQYAKAPDAVSNQAYVKKMKYKTGNIAAIYYNIFEVYHNAPDFYAKNMLSGLIGELSGDRFLVEYKGPGAVDIVTAKKDGRLLISLINTSGIYSESKLRAYDEIPPLSGDGIEITVKADKEPAEVSLQPENKTPEYAYDPISKKLTVKPGSLHIHSIISIG